MNKKVIIGIIAGVLALAIIVVGLVFVSKGFHKGEDKNDKSSSAENTSSLINDDVEAGNVGIADAVVDDDGFAKVKVSVNDNPGIYAGQFFFEYDSKALSYVEYEKGDLFDEYEVAASTGNVNCIISSSGLEDIKNNGDIITLVFKVNDGAASGDYSVKLGDGTMICNFNEQKVVPEITTGKITVK